MIAWGSERPTDLLHMIARGCRLPRTRGVAGDRVGCPRLVERRREQPGAATRGRKALVASPAEGIDEVILTPSRP